MKKICTVLAFLLLLASADLHAQRYPTSGKGTGLYQKNSSIWLDGGRLDKKALSELEGFNYDLYSKGRTKAGIGTALISVGAVPCVIGTIGLVESIQGRDRMDRERKSGIEPTPGSGLPEFITICGYGVGILFEAVGIPLHCSGKADIRHAVESYNGQSDIVFSLGPTTNGVGIALNF